jgi:histidine ammonia-lyase
MHLWLSGGMSVLRIGDEPLTPPALVAAARDEAVSVELTSSARERMAARRAAVDAIVASGRTVYARTTGVGANYDVEVGGEDREHALRLLRSHAAEVGEPLAPEVVRATILIRLNQMAAGAGSHRPELADALTELLPGSELPELRDHGGLGTGDLSVLAQLALALAEGGFALAEGDAAPFIGSNAATLAVATLAWADLGELLDAGLGVSAETFRALDGNSEAFAAAVAAARPLPGLVAVASTLRALTLDAGPPARLQDPFALRCLPQVAGALHDALGGLHDVLAVEIGAAAENPLVADGEILHHGGFHAAPLALALDTVRLAVVPFVQLSVARLAHLMDPRLTGLTPFLAAPTPGSSGLIIAEYVASDALARLRAEAAPSLVGTAVVSRGVEEHASFAWQGALQARRAVSHVRTAIALERLAAERALAIKAGEQAPDDRPLGDDFARASRGLAELAERVRRSGGR